MALYSYIRELEFVTHTTNEEIHTIPLWSSWSGDGHTIHLTLRSCYIIVQDCQEDEADVVRTCDGSDKTTREARISMGQTVQSPSEMWPELDTRWARRNRVRQLSPPRWDLSHAEEYKATLTTIVFVFVYLYILYRVSVVCCQLPLLCSTQEKQCHYTFVKQNLF